MTIRQNTNHLFPPVYRIPVAQFGIAALASAAAGWFGVHQAVSVLLGGLICVVGNIAFIWWFFRTGKSQSPRYQLKQAYRGFFSRLALTALLFGLVLSVYNELNILFLFAGFIAAQTVNWVLPLFFKRQWLDQG